MNTFLPHVAVCICTYRRPELLRRLLSDLAIQHTNGRFTYSVAVVDNDEKQSAKPIVEAMTGEVETTYLVEARQNISRARNKAVANAPGDYVAFIDDDEIPPPNWLLILFDACLSYGVDGVLGPVKPRFENPPPRWIVRGKFYDRPSYPTGFVIDGAKGRTGNVLLKKELFAAGDEPFNPLLLTGEDQDFFRRMIARGRTFIWCEEALAYETVPMNRWKRSFMLRRALLRGKVSIRQSTAGGRDVAKSLLAIPIYSLVIPLLLLVSHAAFMRYLVKLCDHLGRVLACVGMNPMKEVYITE